MIRTIALVAAIGICPGAPIAFAAPPTEVQTPSVEKLIEQLGSKEFAERERAMEMLKTKGVSALPALKKAASHPDHEIGRRVKELIPPLEALVALSPKRVSLEAGKRSLSDALKSIEKQTGLKVELDEGADPEFESPAMKEVPFWEALDRIGRATGRVVEVPRRDEENQTKLKLSKGKTRFLALEGAFRVELVRLHEDRDIDFTENDSDKKPGCRDESLTASVKVLAEPRFLLLHVAKPQLESAIDEDGVPLRWQRELQTSDWKEVPLRNLMEPAYCRSTRFHFQRSTDSSRMIKKLRGAVPIDVVVDRNPIVITDKLGESKGTKFKVSGEDFEITRAEFDESGQFNLEFSVPPNRLDRLSGWRERVRIEDVNGEACSPTGTGSRRSGTEHTILFIFSPGRDVKVGPPCKLIVEDWVIVHHRIGFEFKDVPLP
jgi:hypothetical protein